MHFEKMMIELKPTAPIVVPKIVVDPAPTPASATSLIQHVPSVPYIANPSSPPMHRLAINTRTFPMGKGKTKVMEDDKDEEEEATQKLRKELEDFMIPTKFDNKLLASLLLLPSEYYEGDIGLLQGAKILGGRKGDITSVSLATRVLVLEKNGACDCCIANNLADQCWYLTGECPCWRCCRKSKGCLWNDVGVTMQKKCPPLSALILAKHIKSVQAAKAFLKWQGKSSQFFVLESYKGKGKAKALLGDSKQTGAKRSFKLTELVDSDSNEDKEEDRVHIIKKIKCEHIEELTGTRKRKEIIELEDEVEIVVPKTPAAGPSCQISKPMVLIPSMPKPIPKPIVVLPSPIAGPSTAPIIPEPVSKPATTALLSNPAPVTEVPETQETLQDEESSNKNKDKDVNDDEDGKSDDDDSDNDDTAMDMDSAKRPEEIWPTAPTKTTVTKAEAPVPMPVFKSQSNLNKTNLVLTNGKTVHVVITTWRLKC
ncbi:hypothetical protein C0995_004410 [Termitomyces sp. Mi166|nr:hypothetical protein C0995_004410 [Termitomyces sp. Mi166\